MFSNILKNTLVTLSLIFTILLISLIYRAYFIHQPCHHNITTLTTHKRIQLTPKIIERLQTGLQFPTVSYKRGSENLEAKTAFVEFIRREFSDLEALPFIGLQIINNHSLLYEIKGKNKQLRPYLIAAHYDVVPAEAEQWQFDPFSAQISEGFINARGSMDNKASMISQLEALRLFLGHTDQPERTVYLAYGHDEEISGRDGAELIAKELSKRTKSLEFVLDEGSMVIEDVFPALGRPSACIGIAEKGYLTVRFSVNVTGGHSSMPDNENSAIFILSEAVTKLKYSRPKATLRRGPAKIMLESLAVNLGFVQRVLLTNLWLFAPFIEMIFSRNPTLDSLQRTTTAVTIFNSGVKENVLPSYAEFYVNHRIHNSQSCREIYDFDVSLVGDSRINHEVVSCVEPSAVSPMDSIGYRLLEHLTIALFPDAIVQPSVVPGQTDSRFYSGLTENIYKYLPIRIRNSDLKRYHGVDERISTENYENLVNFFYLIFKNTDTIHLDSPKPQIKAEF